MKCLIYNSLLKHYAGIALGYGKKKPCREEAEEEGDVGGGGGCQFVI